MKIVLTAAAVAATLAFAVPALAQSSDPAPTTIDHPYPNSSVANGANGAVLDNNDAAGKSMKKKHHHHAMSNGSMDAPASPNAGGTNASGEANH